MHWCNFVSITMGFLIPGNWILATPWIRIRCHFSRRLFYIRFHHLRSAQHRPHDPSRKPKHLLGFSSIMRIRSPFLPHQRWNYVRHCCTPTMGFLKITVSIKWDSNHHHFLIENTTILRSPLLPRTHYGLNFSVISPITMHVNWYSNASLFHSHSPPSLVSCWICKGDRRSSAKYQAQPVLLDTPLQLLTMFPCSWSIWMFTESILRREIVIRTTNE